MNDIYVSGVLIKCPLRISRLQEKLILGLRIGFADGHATLKYDPRYKIGAGYDEHRADESTMLTATNLFRLMESD